MIYDLTFDNKTFYHINLIEVSAIMVSYNDSDVNINQNSINIQIIFSGCLKPGMDFLIDLNDFHKAQVTALIDAFHEAIEELE
jgi:N-acetyl-anhydromuramyl-L-alanine amidase AmpD